ncbi:PQQ-dependent sugar dehydrogenase [Penaeicola halotolerans]|uniref:PQQ-dependent sugar dehydrogenase n=1 Tax=Penaeicola halotolerans TaxID=2793196 RepID=UPI001CF87A59|nr:PQQ-dependent sugar dehydrogenase [Penaeicola halotolerans]
MKKNLLIILMSGIMLSPACADIQDPDSTEQAQVEFDVEVVTDKLSNPWGMAWLPDGRMLVTERAGDIRIVQDGKLLADKVQGFPEVYAQGQGGLMDIKLHPDYASNGWIYFTYSSPSGGGNAHTAVLRAKLQGNQLVNQEKLFQALPQVRSGVHYGSRLVFDGNGYMYISVGERGTMQNAQDLSTHSGSIIRLHDDGRIPSDNPFVNQAGAMREIWSYGHRNPQGMAMHPVTGAIWAHEHGPKGGDELNIIQKGKNYGWPLVSYGINYDGRPITDKQEMEGVENPVHYWDPSIAPCGMAFVTGDKYPGWKNSILIGALSFRYVARVEVKDGKFVREEKLLQDIGRVRAIEQGPDGLIYVATESPGQIVRLVPKK